MLPYVCRNIILESADHIVILRNKYVQVLKWAAV